MIIRIASTRVPKIEGVRRALELLTARFDISFQSIRIESVDTHSNVSDTPKSLAELLEGAEYRAKKIFQASEEEESYSVGVEGGLFLERDRVFLQSWTCVFNGICTSFGASGCIELPRTLVHEVIEKNVDLGIAIDAFAMQADIRSNQGTFGILTADLFTREDSFSDSALNAFIPFFNKKTYGTFDDK